MSIINDHPHENFQEFDFDDSPIAAQLAKDSAAHLSLESTNFPKPSTTRIVSVTNQKGGVGKTTTVVNLAVALAKSGSKVLVVDLDPQGNASTALGIPYGQEHRANSSFDLLVGESTFDDCVRAGTSVENLFVVPSNINLAAADLKMSVANDKEFVLKNKLNDYLSKHQGDDRFDYVFLDCPPSMGILVINALTAANEALVTIQAEYYALEGIALLNDTINLVNQSFNPDIKISAALITMFDSRSNLSTDVFNEVRNVFPDQTMNTVIPRNVRIAEAPSFGESVVTYDPRSTGAIAYREAALEFANKGV